MNWGRLAKRALLCGAVAARGLGRSMVSSPGPSRARYCGGQGSPHCLSRRCHHRVGGPRGLERPSVDPGGQSGFRPSLGPGG